ncbi:MAG TPA: hypothetical protein VG711_06000 [Phycisphaerales bacterium]|nr:hypothetical protein [Phycisphaerales bacterium]
MYPSDPQSAPPLYSGSPSPSAQQAESDRSHLNVLSILYYVFGGLNAIGVLFGGFYVLLGFIMPMNQVQKRPGDPPPEFFFWFFVLIGGCAALFSLVFLILDLHTGYSLQKRKNRTMCLITAGISCLSIPLGTTLGVFTFIVLSRPSVKALFEQNANPPQG